MTVIVDKFGKVFSCLANYNNITDSSSLPAPNIWKISAFRPDGNTNNIWQIRHSYLPRWRQETNTKNIFCTINFFANTKNQLLIEQQPPSVHLFISSAAQMQWICQQNTYALDISGNCREIFGPLMSQSYGPILVNPLARMHEMSSIIWEGSDHITCASPWFNHCRHA